MAKTKVSVAISATRFRADLFDYLRQAKAGSEILVRHKDSTFRIAPVLQPSKLERLAALPALDVLNGSWEEFEQSSKRFSEDIRKDWVKKWDRH